MPPGILRTVMPAAPDAWITALERYGTMSFGEVAQAAIRFARDGFAMHAFMAEYIREHEDKYARWPSSAAVFLPQGRPPRAGELFVQARSRADAPVHGRRGSGACAQRDAARDLKAARDAFYRGDIAQTIAKYHRENGGW